MRTKTGGMTVITCNAKTGCTSRFLSASDPRIVEYQACLAGWIKMYTRPRNSDLHACPDHKKNVAAAEVKHPFKSGDR